jgi:glycosyltransferase involved in cell wall biosynthesis
MPSGARRQSGSWPAAPVRVVQVAPTPFGPDGLLGGGERYPLELARALARFVDCELVTFGRRARLDQDEHGLRVRTLPAASYLWRHPAHAVAPGLVRALRGASLVHTHHLRSTPSRLAALASRARGQPTVVTDHGLPGSDWGGLLPRLFDRFLMVSCFSARALRTPPRRTRVVYGGADPARFAPDPTAVRRGVLFVGRLTPHKGVDRLIRALPASASLTIVGSTGHDQRQPEASYPELLRRLADGRAVRFAGAVADRDLPAVLASAQVLALPSVERTCYGKHVPISELLGLVVLEAMASGTPVVCSRLGGLPEIVEHGVTGYLVEPGDVEELRARLDELLRSPERAARFGRAARARVLERFTWRACAERCLAAYAEIV